MRIGLDTNVLVHAHVPSMEHHEAVRDLLFRHLSTQDVQLVLTPLVLHELVHVISDPRRFEPPVPMSEAVAVTRDYLGRSNVECLPLDEPALLLALDLLDRHRLGRKRIADTLVAAVLLHHGVHRFLTFNRADFDLFDGLRVLDPLAG